MEATLHNAAERKDEGAIRESLYGSLDKGELLVRIHHFLSQEALYSEWLEKLLEECGDVWFLCFMRTQPRELICAFEYDYFVRHPSSDRNATVALLESAIDEALLIRYYGLYGISQRGVNGPYGSEVFLTMKPFERLESLMTRGDTTSIPFDDALLNPPLERVEEWTTFHVKMRRLAFQVLKEVIRLISLFLDQQPGVERRRALLTKLSDALDLYASYLSTRIWRDTQGALIPLEGVVENLFHTPSLDLRERIILFFMPPPSVNSILFNMVDHFLLSSPEEWRLLIEGELTIVESGLPFPDGSLILEDLLQMTSIHSCDFIYNGTPEAQQAFHTRVSYLWQK